MPPDGAKIFAARCANCHGGPGDSRAPSPAALRRMTKSAILTALNTGEMRLEALRLSAAERTALADYLGTDAVATAATTGVCARDLDPPTHPPVWNGWGANLGNTRFQQARSAALTVDQVKALKLKWAFGFPGASATYGQPTSYAGKLFVGSEDGTVYALDAATGCSWWTFKAAETVKTAISIGDEGKAAFFGDTTGNVYAVRLEDGSLIWKVHAEQHPAARITGSPLVVGSRLFVPVSSGEEGAAADPKYPCCTFRGSVVALDAKSGKRLWQAYTIPQASHPTQKSKDGVQFSGPSGAAVWSSPTADLKRHLVYVTTGNNYSGPSTATSDAVIALDMNSGAIVWSRQMTPRDLWNSGCVAEHKENCPEKKGDDFDFGAPPLLSHTRRGDVLLLAQKSGVVYALDPDRQGQILWQTRIGRGGPLGGVQWGGAADAEYGYFPLSDWEYEQAEAGGGLFALDLANGKRVWSAAPVKPACVGQFGCSAAQMAPPTLIPGVVLSGSMDGHLRAYDTKDGSIVWDFDATHEFQTVNGVKAHGGSFNGAGASVVGGMVFVNAGYNNAIDGNVLLAFSPE